MNPLRQRVMLRLEQLEDRSLLSAGNVALHLTAGLAATVPILPNGSFLTNQSQVQITGTTTPGDTVRLATGHDTNFNEGSAIAGSNGQYTMTVPLTEGLNTLRLRVIDGSKQANAQLQVTLDDLAPKVVVLKPSSSQVPLVTNHIPTISGQVSDMGSGVKLLQASVDSGAYQTIAFNAKGQFSFTPAVPLSSTGIHIVHFLATDKAGNQSAITNFSFNLDTQAPTIVQTNLTQVNGKTIDGTGSSVITFQFSEPLNPATVTTSNFYLKSPKGILAETIQLSQNNTQLQLSYTGQGGPGNYVFTLVAPAVKDMAGNALGAANLTWHFTISRTYNWINKAGGDWDNPANWDRGQLPGTGDAVVINVPGNVVITHSQGNDSIASLVSADPIDLTGGTLQVSGTVQVNNTFTLAGGTLSGADVLSGSGGQGITLTSAGGVLNGVTTAANVNATQTVGANATIVNGLTLNNATVYLGNNNTGNPTFGRLSFSDTLTQAGPIPQTLGGTGTVLFGVNPSNTLAGNLGLTLGSGIVVRGAMGTISGTVVNKGTINADTIGTISIDPSIGGGTFTNQGTMLSGNGVLVFNAAAGAAIVNDGILTKEDGYPGGGGTVTINGNFTQGSSGVINLAVSGAQDPNGGDFSISGHASLAGALNFLLIDGFVPAAGDGGKTIKYGSETGAFGKVGSTPSLPAGLGIQLTYSADAVVVLVT